MNWMDVFIPRGRGTRMVKTRLLPSYTISLGFTRGIVEVTLRHKMIGIMQNTGMLYFGKGACQKELLCFPRLKVVLTTFNFFYAVLPRLAQILNVVKMRFFIIKIYDKKAVFTRYKKIAKTSIL
jgi:hypothetical protein